MSVQHDTELSKGGFQTFWLELRDDEAAVAHANVYAWLEIGYDDIGDYDSLSGYKRAKFNAAYNQALKIGSVKLAFKTAEVKWLIKQDAEFDVFPFRWCPESEFAEVKITVDDPKVAMLFKLTWGGNN